MRRTLILAALVSAMALSAGCATFHPPEDADGSEGFFSRYFVPDALEGAAWWKKALWFAGPGH